MSFHDAIVQAGLHGIRVPLTGLGSPVGAVTPTAELDQGELYRNTLTEDVWQSTGPGVNDWVLLVDGSPTAAYVIIRDLLERAGAYSLSEIATGLIPSHVFDALDLPTVNPAGAGVPGMAIVRPVILDMQLRVAYWDFTGSGLWVLTSYPYVNPILIPGHVIRQNPTNGAGNSSFLFAMGCFIHVQNLCEIDALAVKFGAGGLGFAHAWAIRKSTVPGPSQPLASTFTNVIASGQVVPAVADVWQDVGDFPGVNPVLAVDDWVVGMVWVNAGGQFANVAALRAAGELREDFALFGGGAFVFVGAQVSPGITPVPTSLVAATTYGMVSLSLVP